MYSAVTVQNGMIHNVQLFESFPIWLEGVGTIESQSDPNLRPTDYGLHVEIVEVGPQTSATKSLKQTLDACRDSAKKDGLRNVWFRSTKKGGYLVAVDEHDEPFEVEFDDVGNVINV